MHIKVGGTYYTRSGRQVFIDFYTSIGVYVGRYIDNPKSKVTVRWNKNGRYDPTGKPNAKDILRKASLDFD